MVELRFDPEVSFRLERLAAGAWPADEVEVVEGWLLRRTEGVGRRRSNSLLPPADPGAAARTVDAALASAEELGFAGLVQVSPAEGHSRLDGVLEAQGMLRDGESYVLAGPLRGTGSPAANITINVQAGRPDPGPVASMPAISVQLGELSSAWVDAWARVGDAPDAVKTAERVLSQLGGRARFAVAVDGTDAVPIGVCIGVVEEGWLGLFALAVAEPARRRGVATMLVDALEDWAADLGAARTYLQVETDNAGALAFYRRRGFHIAHSYHYRSAS